jgi:hypothetical protein
VSLLNQADAIITKAQPSQEKSQIDWMKEEMLALKYSSAFSVTLQYLQLFSVFYMSESAKATIIV